jgi:hypothetical protein
MNTPEKTQLQRLEEDLRLQQKNVANQLRFLELHREVLTPLDLKFSIYSNNIDFDYLKRPDVLRVIKAFGGRWSKRPGYDGGLTYERDEKVDGHTIRVYNGEPPPSCHIIEKVTYRKIPARRERVVTRTVVCSDGTERKL